MHIPLSSISTNTAILIEKEKEPEPEPNENSPCNNNNNNNGSIAMSPLSQTLSNNNNNIITPNTLTPIGGLTPNVLINKNKSNEEEKKEIKNLLSNDNGISFSVDKDNNDNVGVEVKINNSIWETNEEEMNATKKDTWVTKLFLNEYKRNKLEKEIEEEIKVKQAKYDFAYQQQIEKLLPNKKHKQQLQQQQYEYWDNLSSIKIQEQLPTSQIPFQTQTQIETQIEEQSELLSLNKKKEIINENEIDKENINPNQEKRTK